MRAKGREQRRHRRYDVENVQGSLVYQHDAKVLNISLTGMAIETRSLLKVGANYSLSLPFEDSVLKLPADVKWCTLVRTEATPSGGVAPVYQAGIDFRSILDEKAMQVLKFIEDHIIVELDQRIFGRFMMKDGQEVDLDASHEFHVRKISLSGMLIETTFTPETETVFSMELRPAAGPIQVKGRVAYVRQVGRGPDERSEVGVEFQEMEEESRGSLESLIETLLE